MMYAAGFFAFDVTLYVFDLVYRKLTLIKYGFLNTMLIVGNGKFNQQP